MRNGPPLLLLVAALLAVSPSAHDFIQHSGDGKTSTESAETTSPSDPAHDEELGNSARRARSAKELTRLYDAFFGRSAAGAAAAAVPPEAKAAETRKITITSPENQRSTWKVELDAPEDLADPQNALGKGMARTGCTAEFMIALVPDPLDSTLAISFDQAVSAIQMAFVDAGYLPDRFWLPWSGEAGKSKEYRTNPGILLFRREDQCVLSTVFLVGETPKIGIQKEAFRQAVTLIDALASKPREPLRILGPSFSGSIESLEFFFRNDSACGYNSSQRRASIVTGSATSPKLEDLARLRCINVRRTVMQEPKFTLKALGFLHSKMGWDLNRLVLLTESDTTYGQNLSLRMDGNLLEKVQWAQFPSGLAGIREAWESKGEPGDNQNASNSKLNLPKLTLDLSLAEHSEPADTPPESSSLTTRNKDLAIANLLASIRREGLRYVGILATDPRDTIFLARRIKTFAPDTILFTIDNNLLYTHPDYSEFTDNMLVLSKNPLFTETNVWADILGKPRNLKNYMRQFMTDFQQGLFEAARLLISVDLSPRVSAQTNIWITVIGNGSLWPIANIPEDQEPAKIAPQIPARRKALPFLYAGTIILSLGWYLCRLWRQLVSTVEGPLEQIPFQGLASIGMASLWTMGTVLFVVATLFVKNFEIQPALLALAFTICSLLLWISLNRVNPIKTPRDLWKWLLVGGLPVTIGPWALRLLWMPGGAALFQMRANNPSSGLSPVVSLFAACSAVLMWTLWEFKRRGLEAQQGFGWPLQGWQSMSYFSDPELTDYLNKLLKRTFLPRRFWRFWLLLALILAIHGFYLIPAIQPVAETSWYGRVFISLIAFGFILSAISFFRFISLWRALRVILQRIDETEIPARIKNLSTRIAWKPMQSFAWPLPVFKMATLSADHLETILNRPRFREFGRSAAVKDQLEKVFAAHKRRAFAEERGARQELNDLFAKNFNVLKDYSYDPGVASFFAVRLVAWLRHMFAHMRSCLIGSLISAGLLLFAVRSYAFEPKQFVFMSLWVVMLAAVILIFWVFFEMDRNATLSAINGTDAGEISFDRTFVANLLTYGVVPVLGLAATQFPQIGRYFVSLLNPLLRVVGGN